MKEENNKNEVIENKEEQKSKLEKVASEILEKHLEAFKELAK